LNHEEHRGQQTVGSGGNQMLQVGKAARGRRVGEECNPIPDQRHRLDLKEAPSPAASQKEIRPTPFYDRFAAQKLISSESSQRSLGKACGNKIVRQVGVDGDKASLHLNKRQAELRPPPLRPRRLQQHCAINRQELPQPSRVPHMDPLFPIVH
jgi:hypothetical protein